MKTIEIPPLRWVSALDGERQDDGTDVALQVESGDGRKAVLRLQAPASPDGRAR